jgi:regulator of protease activity HflC (stomatin/prohibitin superfamily)
MGLIAKIGAIVGFIAAEVVLYYTLINLIALPAYNKSYYGLISWPIAGFAFLSLAFSVSVYGLLRYPIRTTKIFYAAMLIGCIGISIGATIYLFNETHYAIFAGKVGIVTDEIGRIISVDVGPTLWAEKAIWETVKPYDVMVQTEDMLSPSKTIENGTIIEMSPEPQENLRYGAVRVNCLDGPNTFLDVTVQWHIFTNATETDKNAEWRKNIAALYLDYPSEDYATKTLIPHIRNAIYNYAGKFTIDEIVYRQIMEFSENLTPYVQEFVNNMTTLHHTVVIDAINVRTRVPPVDIQRIYIGIIKARKQAEITMINANATRDSAIQIALGQGQAIEIVANASSASLKRLMEQNVTGDKVLEYLGLQYMYETLKKVAADNPDWKMTLIINSPDIKYTYPIDQSQP